MDPLLKESRNNIKKVAIKKTLREVYWDVEKLVRAGENALSGESDGYERNVLQIQVDTLSFLLSTLETKLLKYGFVRCARCGKIALRISGLVKYCSGVCERETNKAKRALRAKESVEG